MYFFRKNGKIKGPFSVDKLKELSARGMIERTTEISDDKIAWKRADAFRELFSDERKKADPELKKAEPPEEPAAKSHQIKIKKPDGLNDTELPPQHACIPNVFIPQGDPPGPPFNSPSPDDKQLNFLELLWNPVEALPKIYTQAGERKSAFIGSGMMIGAALSLFIAIKTADRTGQASSTVEIIGLLLGLTVPFAGMIFASFITRKYLSNDQASGGFGGDCLISGSALLLFSIAIMATALMMHDQAFFYQKGIFIALAILIYAYTSSVLVLYAGITAISGISKSLAPIVIPLMIAITTILSGLVLRQFILKMQ